MKKKSIDVNVPIPSSDGKSIAYTIKTKVQAVYDPDYEDYILNGEALAVIDKIKARHMGLISPEEMKTLRTRLGVTQEQIADLLQIGKKSWTRWETGREYPSRSINILIRALQDRKIDLNYLRSMKREESPIWGSITQMNQRLNKNFAVETLSQEDFGTVEADLQQKVA